MRASLYLVLLLGGLVVEAAAHDWWIRAVPAHPQTGNTVRFEIGGGHRFPESEERLATRLLHAAYLTGPDGDTQPLAFSPEEVSHRASTTLAAPGVYRADFQIKRPGDEAPIIAGRTLVVVGGQDTQSMYAGNQGLEIVPLSKVSTWQTGAEVSMEVRLNGEVVPAMIRLERVRGRRVRMRTTTDRPAIFRRWIEGPSLFVVEYGDQTATLTVWPVQPIF